MEVPSSRRKTHRQGGAKDGTALGMPSQRIMSLLIAADLPQGTPFPRPVLMPGNRTLCPCNIPFLGRGDALEKPKQQNSTSKIPAYCLIPNERRKKNICPSLGKSSAEWQGTGSSSIHSQMATPSWMLWLEFRATVEMPSLTEDTLRSWTNPNAVAKKGLHVSNFQKHNNSEP